MRAWCLGVTLGTIVIFATTGCGRPVAAGPQRQNGAWVTEVPLGEGDTGKPSLEALKRQEEALSRPRSSELSPLHFGAGKPEEVQLARKKPSWAGYQSGVPDPPPIESEHQMDVALRYKEGSVSIKCAKPVTLKTPITTVRHMGRFAFELWIGRELVDRVRFDFPLMGGPPLKPSPLHGKPPNFEDNADFERQIRLPSADRAVRAVVVDRANGRVWEFPWPYTDCDATSSDR